MVLANDTTGELASATTIATDAGTWSVSLSVGMARPTSTVTIASSGQPTIVLEDVAWGDVFLCSGQVILPDFHWFRYFILTMMQPQSNMEYFVADAFYGDAERNASSHPSLRMLNLADVAVKDVDATDCPSKAPYTWAASAPVLHFRPNSPLPCGANTWGAPEHDCRLFTLRTVPTGDSVTSRRAWKPIEFRGSISICSVLVCRARSCARKPFRAHRNHHCCEVWVTNRGVDVAWCHS